MDAELIPPENVLILTFFVLLQHLVNDTLGDTAAC